MDDLQGFYQSLPYPELKKFDRKAVEKSLNNLLVFVYKETRNKDVNSMQCKKLIGNEMNKLIEGKHLRSLSMAMGIFVEGVKELIRPYLEDVEMTQATPVVRDASMIVEDESDEEIQVTPRVEVPYEEPRVVFPYVTPEYKKRQDEDFLKQLGPLEGMFANELTPHISKKTLTVFKRIIGFPPELSKIEPTPEMVDALNILLEHCEKIDLVIYKGNILTLLISKN